MGHHLYEENKRLKAENDALREQANKGREVNDHDIIVNGIGAFFQGTARIRVERNGDDYSIRFEF